MAYNIDKKYLLDSFRKIVETPSPTGYYVKLNPVMKQMAEELGYTVTYDKKSTTYITIEGEDNSKTVQVGAHADTLGMVVRGVASNGWIKIRKLGGLNLSSVEGETVTVHTRDGREYTGLVICKSHSVHGFDDAHSLQRTEDTIFVLLDEDVYSEKDVRALGIQNGDVISVDPRCQFTPSGFVKSRFLDDKGSVACIFAMLKYFKENNLKPKYRTIVAIPYYEEVGAGGTFVPAEVEEFVSVDIGLVGPDCEGNEHAATIIAKDSAAPYDYELTSRLIRQAKEIKCNYAIDVFYHYSSDANASVRAGNDLRHAAFGLGVYCSHGMERTHVDALVATTELLIAYMLDV